MNNFLVHTPDEILYTGLTLVGFSDDRQQVCRDTSLVRFRSHYGSNPLVYSELCEDLQTTNIAEARVDDMKIHYFLMSIHFLKCYPTAEQQSALFKVDEKTARKWTRFYISKIAALKPQKVHIILFIRVESMAVQSHR